MSPPRASTVLLALAIVFVGLSGPFVIAPRDAHQGRFPASANVGRFQAGGGERAVRATSEYLLGTGVGDMMGYAMADQVGTGLHMRQRARAFLVAEAGDPTKRVLFINAGCGMGDSAITRGVLQKLEELCPGVYSALNVALAGTHAHSGVGGFLENLLPQITSLGFVPQTYEAIVAGAIVAAQRAHDNLAPGSLSLGNTTLLDTSINRSPTAYLANPESERSLYGHDTDKDFSLLRFDDASTGKPKGFLSFFAVHGTSLYNNNTLISGDNKGMAAFLSEEYFDPSGLPGNTSFVAGFAQASVGDTSPNTEGVYCESPGKPYDGQPCDVEHSTCGGNTEECHGRGPGFRVSDFESNRIIGQNQHHAAVSLMEGPLAPVSGPIASTHQYITIANYTFTLPDGSSTTLCSAALGYGFAGGTTDGPGAQPFMQGDASPNSGNPFLDMVMQPGLPPPTEAQSACQAPKPVLINSGALHVPYDWAPAIVAVQMFRIGQLVIILSPSELTTMAGRRLRATVRGSLISLGILDSSAHIVIGTIANGAYSHYTTTREEYSAQRYEGASTLFGPATLEAYQHIFGSLVPYLATNASATPPAGTPPPNLIQHAISLQAPVVADSPPIGKSFGSLITDVNTSTPYSPGAIVSAVFVGANPRNNLRLESTFLIVQRSESGVWRTFKTDSHPSTTFQWAQTDLVLGSSTSNVSWIIENDTLEGEYRIQYFGDAKSLTGARTSFSGVSSVFTV